MTHNFDSMLESYYDDLKDLIQPNRLQDLLFALTDIHSPTGSAATACQFLVNHLQSYGIDAQFMPFSGDSGAGLATLPGDGSGANLLLYAPIDTHLEGDDSDYPWTGRGPTVDTQPRAVREGDWVYGLGSSNPKAMVATLAEIMICAKESGIRWPGTLTFGFADGGMPVDISARHGAGMSHGIFHLLSRGALPDFCIVMKPWNWVYHEEPGMAWFKITVWGTLGYAGVPRGTPGFRSSIVPAAQLILDLEEWLPAYTERHTSGDIRPDGWISAVRAGWPERPAFPSAATEIYFDVRVNPRCSPAQVRAEFAEFINTMRANRPELECEWQMYGSVPGGSTDVENWIIQSARRGWEEVEKTPYPAQSELLGGQTDGSLLRALGIPTARMGWPWPAEGSPLPVTEGLGGMGATYIPDLIPCAEKILFAVVDTCARDRGTVMSVET